MKLSAEDQAKLVGSNPVTCMRHVQHRFQTCLKWLLKPRNGIFNSHQLKDFYTQIEYQMRGSPHLHGLYWVLNAPKYIQGNQFKDGNSELECIKFINQFITCKRDEEGDMDNLIGYQIHRHSHTCRNGKRAVRKCRFSYSKRPLE